MMVEEIATFSNPPLARNKVEKTVEINKDVWINNMILLACVIAAYILNHPKAP